MATLKRDRAGNYVCRFWTNGRGSRLVYENFGRISHKEKCEAALIATLALAFVFSGCSTSLRSERAPRMTKHEADIAPCRFLGDVYGKHYGDDAAALGGDVVLYPRGWSGFSHPTKEHPFKAYDCGGRYSRGPSYAPAVKTPAAPPEKEEK